MVQRVRMKIKRSGLASLGYWAGAVDCVMAICSQHGCHFWRNTATKTPALRKPLRLDFPALKRHTPRRFLPPKEQNMSSEKLPPAPSRSLIRLNRQTERNLRSYAVAAGAAGVGALALAHPAEGKIIFTPTNQTIAPNTT